MGETVSTNQRGWPRRAVTLVEVLLVLALLVMLASIAWPALGPPMANQRLRKAADKVRTSWAATRVDAMSSGQTFLFRCAIDGSQYQIEAQAGPESVDEITSSMPGQFDEAGTTQTEPTVLSQTEYSLPDKIRFVEGDRSCSTPTAPPPRPPSSSKTSINVASGSPCAV